MIIIGLLLGCASKMDEATVKNVVDKAILESNVTTGHYGYELLGKGQWYSGKGFINDCLMGKELAYPNYNKIGEITPNYFVQNTITASSKKGYCIDLGEDLTYTIDKIEQVSATGSMDIQNVTVSFSFTKPSPWVECLEEGYMTRTIRVENLDGTPKLNAKDSLALQDNNGCPNPIPGTQQRKPSSRPQTPATTPPTKEAIQQLAQKFDDALFEKKFDLALEMVSCVNLYEDNKWGTCVISELITLGASTHGDEQMEGPWMEGTQYNFNAIESIVADKQDPTLFHVTMPHRKSKALRSFSVQWVNGSWKMFGAVSIMSNSITAMRFMNDFHDPVYRDALEKRLAGEKVDYKGKPLDPKAAEEKAQ
jgi:hypothetical protein